MPVIDAGMRAVRLRLTVSIGMSGDSVNPPSI